MFNPRLSAEDVQSDYKMQSPTLTEVSYAFTVVPSFGAKKAEFFTFENSDRCWFKL